MSKATSGGQMRNCDVKLVQMKTIILIIYNKITEHYIFRNHSSKTTSRLTLCLYVTCIFCQIHNFVLLAIRNLRVYMRNKSGIYALSRTAFFIIFIYFILFGKFQVAFEMNLSLSLKISFRYPK